MPFADSAAILVVIPVDDVMVAFNAPVFSIVLKYVCRYAIVEFQTTQGVMFEFSDSTTGTPSDKLVDAGGAYSQSNINNNFSSLSLKINTIVRRLGN